MTVTEFFAHAGAFATGYIFTFILIRGTIRIYKNVTHWYSHWKEGSVHMSEEQWQEVINDFLENYDDTIYDPETSHMLFGVCRKCRKMKKNFVGEGRKRMCMDCAFGEDNG